MLAAVVVLAASCSHPAGPVDGTATSSTSSTKVAGSSKPAPPRAGPSPPERRNVYASPGRAFSPPV
ncbi:hypothetical protein I552_6491 [Mycobacterium xenopi 3993]|nr:hypothetical protein I552_6491 [Mycobacterium xenopi 3993]